MGSWWNGPTKEAELWALVAGSAIVGALLVRTEHDVLLWVASSVVFAILARFVTRTPRD